MPIKNTFVYAIISLFITLSILPVSAAENYNQQRNSVIFNVPKTQEHPNLKSGADKLHDYCENIQKEMNELEYRPIRKNAANERYKAECMR